jgi:hypothetical protein
MKIYIFATQGLPHPSNTVDAQGDFYSFSRNSLFLIKGFINLGFAERKGQLAERCDY